MYIKSAEITNIRSVEKFKIEFSNPAGWHVLIGDNGAGKSTIIRSIALALVGPEEALGLRADWKDWLNRQSEEGEIILSIESGDMDQHSGQSAKLKNKFIPNIISFKKNKEAVSFTTNKTKKTENGTQKAANGVPDPMRFNWGHGKGWFSVAYGPYRRFAGGNQEWTKVYYTQPKLGAHLSAFGEDVALTEAIEWLVKLNYQQLEGDTSAGIIIQDIQKLVNSADFLPHKAEIESISSEGVMFKDGNGSFIHVNQLSDGYRSILSMTFELIRQLVRVYSPDEVFKAIRSGVMKIDMPGVVLIDEIDAHLHPTWQTRIGQWFTKYFPQIQFIVTTHSPLICRACEKGSIWRLAAPGTENVSGEVKGIERNQLIFGNVLDAYGTEIFGTEVTISKESVEMKEKLVALNNKNELNPLPDSEMNELKQLRLIFSTDAPTSL